MTIYHQVILGPNNGKVACSSPLSTKDAVAGAVRMAIRSNWKPPRWWQFWLPRWPVDCIAEYYKQTQ